MDPLRRIWALAVGVLLVAAACGNGTDGPTLADEPTLRLPNDVVLTVEDTELGPTLVSGEGRTVYVYSDDEPGVSNCDEVCLSAWPAFIGENVGAERGVDESQIDALVRESGERQVLFGNRPLYLFAGDANPGDVKGHRSGGAWFALSPEGEPLS